MSSTAHLEVSNRSAYQKVAFLLVLAGAILCLPYFAPVELSVSRSYVAGFSNRAALLIFTLGTALFAIFTGGMIGETEANNNHLSYRILFAAMSAAGLLALARTCITHSGLPGYEAAYLINRQQLLAAGIAPYFHFEFPYGPALLYPASWIARLMHLSQVEGYDIWWVFQWIAGTSMIWGTVCAIDFPLTQRRKLFLLLFLTQVSMIPNGGSNYTPLRAYCAASLVVATHWVWRRSGSDFQFALVSVLAVGLALCVSPEQGIGLVVGLFVYFLILVRSRAKIFRWSAIVVFIVGSSFCFGAAAHFGAFVSFRAFASGGYSYPVLPSPTIFLGLFAYVMAGCVLARTLYLSRLNSVV